MSGAREEMKAAAIYCDGPAVPWMTAADIAERAVLRERERADRLDRVLKRLRPVARACGYAIAVHGSLNRDLDLIAVPWIDTATDPPTLIERLCEQADLMVMPNDGATTEPVEYPVEKPRGRQSWALAGCPAPWWYIDLSVVDPLPMFQLAAEYREQARRERERAEAAEDRARRAEETRENANRVSVRVELENKALRARAERAEAALREIAARDAALAREFPDDAISEAFAESARLLAAAGSPATPEPTTTEDTDANTDACHAYGREVPRPRDLPGGRAMRIAYADPPYIGQAKKHYGKDGDPFTGEVGEVDHAKLIVDLHMHYDAWALSASAPSLRTILPMCPPEARVLVWVKPFGAYKRNVRVAYVWEPVIVVPAPRRDGNHPTRDFAFDSEVVSESITMKRGLAGAKPERFCFWLFNVLGALPGDEFVDLFPGTGGVTAAWERWCELGAPKLKQSVKTTNDLVDTRS